MTELRDILPMKQVSRKVLVDTDIYSKVVSKLLTLVTNLAGNVRYYFEPITLFKVMCNHTPRTTNGDSSSDASSTVRSCSLKQLNLYFHDKVKA